MSYIKSATKGVSGVVVGIVGFLVLSLVIGLIGVYGFGWFQRETANYRGETEAIEQTKANADFRLYSYNIFFDLCGDVQSLEDRIENAEDKVKRSDDGSNAESDAQTELDALEARRSQLVRDYNAKASRDFTEGQFRDSSLPYRLDIDDMETQCN